MSTHHILACTSTLLFWSWCREKETVYYWTFQELLMQSQIRNKHLHRCTECVNIPSVLRYWTEENSTNIKTKKNNPVHFSLRCYGFPTITRSWPHLPHAKLPTWIPRWLALVAFGMQRARKHHVSEVSLWFSVSQYIHEHWTRMSDFCGGGKVWVNNGHVRYKCCFHHLKSLSRLCLFLISSLQVLTAAAMSFTLAWIFSILTELLQISLTFCTPVMTRWFVLQVRCCCVSS